MVEIVRRALQGHLLQDKNECGFLQFDAVNSACPNGAVKGGEPLYRKVEVPNARPNGGTYVLPDITTEMLFRPQANSSLIQEALPSAEVWRHTPQSSGFGVHRSSGSMRESGRRSCWSR